MLDELSGGLQRLLMILRNAKIVPSLFLLGFLTLGLVGCGLHEQRKTDSIGAYQLIDRDKLEEIDLNHLVKTYSPNSAEIKATCKDSNDDPDFALGYFRCAVNYVTSHGNEQEARNARNALQERILAASIQRCNAFKEGLQRSSSGINFGLGVSSTAAGTVGALVKGVSSKYWSAASAIFSGARAEYNQDYLSNLAAYVVIDGIDRRQKDVYRQIQKQGQEKPYAEYPVEAAVKDALYYHGLCSIMTGFQVAQDSIKEVEDPGLNRIIPTLAKIRVAQQLTGPVVLSEDQIIEKVKKIADLELKQAGSYLDGDTTSPLLSPEQVLNADLDTIKKKDEELNKEIAKMKKEADEDKGLKDKLAALKLQPPPVFGEYGKLPECLNKLKALQSEMLQHQKETVEAKNDADRAYGSVLANESKATLENIIRLFDELTKSYNGAAENAIKEWISLFAQARKTGSSEDATAFGKFLSSQPKPALNQKILDDLKERCK